MTANFLRRAGALPASPPAMDGPQALVILRRMVIARWWMLSAIVAAILAVPGILDIPLPLWPMLAITAVLAIWNGVSHQRLHGGGAVHSVELLGQIGVDLTAFAALLFFSGGATNPFVFMLLPPVAVAALTLPQRMVAAIAVLAIVAYSLLMVAFVPLQLSDPTRATRLHLAGMWVTFVVSVAMITWFILRMMEALRQRDAELAAAREQALRDEKILALGTLAAGAAHDLGTPLATMAILANELEQDAGLGAEARADLRLIGEQIAYCKRIITGLTEQGGAGRSEHAEPMRCDAWLKALHDDWRASRGKPRSTITKVMRSGIPGVGAGDTAPLIVAESTLSQGLVNLLDNAVRAGAPVDVLLDWDAAEVRIEIRDCGPGFSDAALDQAGRLPFPPSASGSGIGLILTHAAIERAGGHLQLSNAKEGGAVARIVLPLARIGAHG